MAVDRRRRSAYDKSFYMLCAGVFAVLTLAGVAMCLLYGLTEMRLFIIFAGFWFLIFTMDLIERRFRRASDRIFWRQWFSLRPDLDSDDVHGGDPAHPS